MPPKKASEPVKDPEPPGTLQAMATGLSVASEPGLSVVDRFGPAAMALVHIAVLVLMMFPAIGIDAKVAGIVLAFTGPVAAAWAARLGAKR